MTNDKSLRLLICNDDGISALGIRTLANTLAIAGHEVTVVCPDGERSATGHGLTLHQPIRAELVESVFHPQVIAWSCSGTPADCVKFALSAVLTTPPDFVISGINHGANLGTDVLYSGTVSGAMEGIIAGINSIAISLTPFSSRNFQPAANFAVKLIAQLQAQTLSQPIFLNVNVPPGENHAGVLITRQGIRRYTETFDKRVDPRGKSYYWLVGEVIEEIPQPDHPQLPADIMTDVEAIKQNYISITPLQYNLTDNRSINYLQSYYLEKKLN